MTPVELIALVGCSRPEGGRACSICVSAAEVHVQAVESAGLVVVSTEDLRAAADVLATVNDPWRHISEEPDLEARLRAALPERRTDA